MNTIWMARLQGTDEIGFDGNREISREGLPQITPGGETVSQTLENLLYPRLVPIISIEVQDGENIKQFNDPDLLVDLYYEVRYRGIDISNITINDGENLENGTNRSQSNVFQGQLIQNISKNFIAKARDAEGNQVQASALVDFKRAIWFGALAITPEQLQASLNTSMDQLGFSKILSNEGVLNRDYDCTGGKYIYVAYPSHFGNPTEVKTGVFDFSDYDVVDIQAMDHFGNRMSYKLLYTGYQTGEDINLNIVRIEQEIL